MLVHQVHQTLTRSNGVCPGDRVLLAVSGGPDSVALTHVLAALARRLEITLGIAHVNHGLREDALDDEIFCAALARDLGFPFFLERADVRAEARVHRRSLEEQGRITRYRFFERVAREERYQRVATGHTRNDQAETLLLRLLRGAGTSGLSGIEPSIDLGGVTIVRPLLAAGREEVLVFLGARGLAYREDPTNQDLSIERNRVRHRALPELADAFNPRLVEALARTASVCRDEDAFLEAEADAASRDVMKAEEGAVTLAVKSLSRLHPALKRRVIRKALSDAKGDLRSIGVAHIEAVLQLTVGGKSGHSVFVPGLEVARHFGEIRIARPRQLERRAPYEIPLVVPGETEIPGAGGSLSVEEVSAATLPSAVGSSVVIAASSRKLSVRSPRHGDRFQPLGAPGGKPLRRYLMERRVDRMRRTHVPVVADGETILWVVGHSISEASRARPGERGLLGLEWKERGR